MAHEKPAIDQQPEQLPMEIDIPERSEMTKDDLFHVLQNERRRRVLRYIVQNGPGPFEMRAIAEQVAAWEHDTTLQALTSDQRQRVYIALYQTHLPKLDEQGLIDYNQSRGIVEERPLIEQTVEHLSIPDEETGETGDADGSNADADPSTDEAASKWRQYYGGATVFSLFLVAGTWASVLPIAMSGLSVATVVAGMFSALTLGLIGRSKQ